MNNIMHHLTRLVGLARTRNGLLVIVGALLLLNGFRLINGKYAEILQAVTSKQALLGQYRMSTKDIEALRARSQQLEARKAQFESNLFSAATEKDATSAMQIKLQEVMAKVGMNPESVSAVGKGGKDSGNPYGAVSIKVRLGGNLDSFVKLLAELYKMNTLFRVESFTVKPFKKEELKIFLELKGYYRLTEPPADKEIPKKEPAKRALQKKGDSGHKGDEQP